MPEDADHNAQSSVRIPNRYALSTVSLETYTTNVHQESTGIRKDLTDHRGNGNNELIVWGERSSRRPVGAALHCQRLYYGGSSMPESRPLMRTSSGSGSKNNR